MAKDSQRAKAMAIFGKSFFENSKCGPAPKNSMTAQQKVANSRPIPTFKVGGKVSKDFTGPMTQAAARAEKKGMPVMKDGGPSKDFTAKRVAARMEAGTYKNGGSADRYKRKMDDIEKDYRIAIAKGKNADVAKAKMEQRVADAKDDLAKWTGKDRTATKAGEKAAEAALTEARKTNGRSVAKRDAERSFGRELEAKADMPKKMSIETGADVAGPVLTKASAPAPATRRPAAAPVRRAGPTARAAAPAPATAAPRNPQPDVAGLKAAADLMARVGSAVRPQARPAAPAGPRTDEAAALRARRAAELEAGAAEKRKLETAPAGAKGAALARLKNVFGFGSSGDLSEAKSLRAQSAAAQNIAKQRAAAAQRQQAEQAERAKANAARVAKLRAAGDNMKADFYERNPNALKNGGKPGKYAAGGAGKVRKGMMKGK